MAVALAVEGEDSGKGVGGREGKGKVGGGCKGSGGGKGDGDGGRGDAGGGGRGDNVGSGDICSGQLVVVVKWRWLLHIGGGRVGVEWW